MKKKNIILGIFLTILLLSIVFRYVDFSRIRHNKKPLFVVLVKKYKDGGSKEYLGLGYKVISCHNLSGDNSQNIGFYSMDINNVCINSSDMYTLYHKVIDNLINGGINSEYLSINLKSFKYLDEHYKNLLVEYCQKYNPNVLTYSYEELKENGYVEDNDLDLKGHLISINNFSKFNNKIVFEIGLYHASLGAKGFGYQATFENNTWKIVQKYTFMS